MDIQINLKAMRDTLQSMFGPQKSSATFYLNQSLSTLFFNLPVPELMHLVRHNPRDMDRIIIDEEIRLQIVNQCLCLIYTPKYQATEESIKLDPEILKGLKDGMLITDGIARDLCKPLVEWCYPQHAHSNLMALTIDHGNCLRVSDVGYLQLEGLHLLYFTYEP